MTALSDRNFPKLKKMMEKHLVVISHADAILIRGDFTGMGSEDVVPMADVPDFFWKPRLAKQGFDRPLEGSNHFADMDQKGTDGKTLLQITKDPANVDPAIWEHYYDGISDILSGKKIAENRRGLLPFRVWQIFDAMCEFAVKDLEKFICAAGVLTHCIGDACQPLHISYLHDGDPERTVTHTFTKGKKAGTSEERPMGQGVHSAYEDQMIFDNREKILAGLKKTPKPKRSEYIATGKEAAELTIDLMRNTFNLLPPAKIVQTYIDVGKGGRAASNALWSKYGEKTIKVMQDGTHVLAVLWESAWEVAGGDKNMKLKKALTPEQAMNIVKKAEFLPSMSIGTIGAILRRT